MQRHIIEDSLGRRQAKRLHQYLQKTLRRAGPGSIMALEKKLGVRSGWLRYKRFRGTLELSHLLQILHLLDLDPATFFSEAFGENPAAYRLDQAKGKAPLLVRKVVQRFADKMPAKPPGLQASDLRELDQQRRDSPKESLQGVASSLDRAAVDQLPMLLGIAGSAWRHMFQLDKARHALNSGLQMAEELRDSSLTADVLQRLGYVVADSGEYANAWRLARRATEIYTQTADFEGIGRSFVDQGIWLFYLDRVEEAIAAQEAALRYLPASAMENRCAAMQNLGLYYRQRGATQRAAEYAEQARALDEALDPFSRARLIWLQGQIEVDQGNLESAERFLGQAATGLMSLHPADAALVTTELVHLQLRRGHPERAYKTAGTMISLVEPLSRHPHISAAIIELLRCCLSGRGLGLSLVVDVETRLRKERERVQRPRYESFQ